MATKTSPHLTGALGKRTTVGQVALGGGGDHSGPVPPRQREKSLIMAGTPSGRSEETCLWHESAFLPDSWRDELFLAR